MLSKTDGYKLSHEGFSEKNTKKIYSNMTPRSSKYFPAKSMTYDNKVVVFGIQKVIKQMLSEWDSKFFKQPKNKVIAKYKRIFDAYLGEGVIEMNRFEKLHDLGYLPILIKALPEGALIDYKIPFWTIENTDDDYAWLTNYLETWLSAESWKAPTVATIVREFRIMADKYATDTTGSNDGVMFQLHDFSYRGMANTEDSAFCGAAFLLSSCGTDSIPALELIEDFYNTDISKEIIGLSVPASEHSISSQGIAVSGELETIRRWITECYPMGIVSVISDTIDFFRVITEYATVLKTDIMTRQKNSIGLAKTVFRPDSGDPVKIVTGWNFIEISDLDISGVNEIDESNVEVEAVLYQGKYYEFDIESQYDFDYERRFITLGREIRKCEVDGSIQCLWDIFGGTTTNEGYRILDEHVGLIYGDGITYQRAKDIFDRLKIKNFASVNVVFGLGSWTLSGGLTRDSLGLAVKCTYSEVGDNVYELSKDPITDDGTKKSAKGLLRVDYINGKYVLKDQCTKEEADGGELLPLLKDGVLLRETTFAEIRNRIWS